MSKSRKVNKKLKELNGVNDEDKSRTSTAPVSTILPRKSNHITEKEILESTQGKDLLKLINSLTNNEQDVLFNEYKQKTSLQFKQDSQLIKQLNAELIEKQKIIDQLLKEKSASKSSYTDTPIKSTKERTYESPIRKKQKHNSSNIVPQDQLSKELENIGITLDMMELLTGLRIVDYREDETKFYFDIKQNSTNNNQIYIEYRLIISKKFESTAEINYVPTFLEVEDQSFDDENEEVEQMIENARLLKDNLPEYLCDNLSFPYNTLSQFYNKINRALHKIK